MADFCDLLPATPRGQPFVPIMPPADPAGPYVLPSPFALRAAPPSIAQYFAPTAVKDDPTASGAGVTAAAPADQPDLYSSMPSRAPASPPPSATQFPLGGRDDPAASRTGNVARGPLPPSLAPVVVASETPLAARLGLGALSGTGALATAFLLGSTRRTAEDDDYQMNVLRAGISQPETLINNVSELSGVKMPGQYGISSSHKPRLTVDQLLAIARYPGYKNVTWTTVPELANLGFRVVETPGANNPVHADIVLPNGQTALTADQAIAISALFRKHIRPNPFYVPKK